MKSLEIIGDSDFERICKEFGVDENGKKILKEIIEEWDRLFVSVKNDFLRYLIKREVALKKIASLELPQQIRVVICLYALMRCLVMKAMNPFSKN